MNTTKYTMIAVTKKADVLLRREAKKYRRNISTEAEILFQEAVDAREKNRKDSLDKSR